MIIEETKDNYLFSTDKARLNINVIHNYLTNKSYWSKGIPLDTLKRSIDNSECFGIYSGIELIGFARVVTDKATFGYLGDVFVLDDHRGKGLSKQLMTFILKHPELQGFRRWMLLTRDVQELYSKFGFIKFHAPDRCMELWFPDIYKNDDSHK